MRDLPAPGLEPVSPALAGGFLTTAPSGKPPGWPLSQSYLVILEGKWKYHLRVFIDYWIGYSFIFYFF